MRIDITFMPSFVFFAKLRGPNGRRLIGYSGLDGWAIELDMKRLL